VICNGSVAIAYHLEIYISTYRGAPLPSSVEYEKEGGPSEDAEEASRALEPPDSPFGELPPMHSRPRLSARALSSSMRRSGKSRRNAGDSRGSYPEIQPDDSFTPLSGTAVDALTEFNLNSRGSQEK
jgi:hypothetical protein